MKIARLFVLFIISSLVGENLCATLSKALISKTEPPSLFVKCDKTLSLVRGNLCSSFPKELFDKITMSVKQSTITHSEQLNPKIKPPPPFDECDVITEDPSPISQLIESKSTPKREPSNETLFEKYILLMTTESFANDLFATHTKDDKSRVEKEIPHDQKLTTLKHYKGNEAGALFSVVLDFLKQYQLYTPALVKKLKDLDYSTVDDEKKSKEILFDYFTHVYPNQYAKMLIKLMTVGKIIRAFRREDGNHETEEQYWKTLETPLYGGELKPFRLSHFYYGLNYLDTEFVNNEENFLLIGADPQISTLNKLLKLARYCNSLDHLREKRNREIYGY